MTAPWSRRAFLASLGASAAALAGCGSGTIESALKPTRFISFGDGFSDVGQGGVRYTVNDGTVNIWAQQLAARFGLPLVAASSGGTSYARGGARVADIGGQIDSFLASGTFGLNDVVLINGGLADVVAAVTAGTADTPAKVSAAGQALGALVKRLVAAGAKYVVVAGLYNLGRSPWGLGITAFDLAALTNTFNQAMEVALVDFGSSVLYVDAALFFNLVTSPVNNAYAMSNLTVPVCTTPDATTCTASTIVAGLDYSTSVFADNLYFTPQAHRLFGNEAYSRLTTRW